MIFNKIKGIFVLVLLLSSMLVYATESNETEFDLLDSIDDVANGGLKSKLFSKFDNMSFLDYVILIVAVIVSIFLLFYLIKSGIKATLLAILLVIIWQIATRLMNIY